MKVVLFALILFAGGSALAEQWSMQNWSMQNWSMKDWSLSKYTLRDKSLQNFSLSRYSLSSLTLTHFSLSHLSLEDMTLNGITAATLRPFKSLTKKVLRLADNDQAIASRDATLTIQYLTFLKIQNLGELRLKDSQLRYRLANENLPGLERANHESELDLLRNQIALEERTTAELIKNIKLLTI